MDFTDFLVVCIIIVLMGVVMFALVLDSYGKQYTEEKWNIAEQYYCSSHYGMKAKHVVSTGRIIVENTICVGENGERKINYNDDIFCQYTIMGDLGLCCLE